MHELSKPEHEHSRGAEGAGQCVCSGVQGAFLGVRRKELICCSMYVLQSTLRRACASTRRGKKASREQQLDILRQVEALEGLDSTPDPARSPLISGRWSLLYTGMLCCLVSGDIGLALLSAKMLSMIAGKAACHDTGPGRADDLTWEARTGGVEGPVLAALRPVSANAVTSKVGGARRSSWAWSIK